MDNCDYNNVFHVFMFFWQTKHIQREFQDPKMEVRR